MATGGHSLTDDKKGARGDDNEPSQEGAEWSYRGEGHPRPRLEAEVAEGREYEGKRDPSIKS